MLLLHMVWQSCLPLSCSIKMTSQGNSSAVSGLVRKGKKLSTAGLQSLAFNVHGVTTRAMTNSSTVSQAVANFLHPFSRDETGGPPGIEVYLFAVDSLTDDMAPVPQDARLLYDWGMIKVFCSGPYRYLEVDGRARVLADLQQNKMVGFSAIDLLESGWIISHMIFYPLWAQLIKAAGLFPLHGAGLVRDGKGFLFLGRSGSGKSTLALHLVRSGYRLLSDDTVFLKMGKEGKVEALCFPEEINVSRQTIELLPELSGVKNFTVNEHRHKSSFSIEELYPGSLADRSRPVALVFPEITDSEATAAEPVSRTEALELSMRYGYFFLDPSTIGKHLEILSQLARQTDCFRLYCGRNQAELERVLSSLLSGSIRQTGEEKE